MAIEHGSEASQAHAKPASSGKSSPTTRNTDKRPGMFIRISPDDKQRAQYWANRRGFSSLNEYIAEAVAEQIRRENHDYHLPTLEVARINQLVDEVRALSTNSANLERVLIQGFDSLIGLTRGGNYLLDDEDGELS